MQTLVATYPSTSLEAADALVTRCLSGDRKAQFEVYRMYNKAMYNVCMRIVGDADEAKDVLQEAFVSAFRHLASFKRESTFGAWLKRIVINASVQHVKRKRADFVQLNPRIHGRIEEEESVPAAAGLASDDETSYDVRRVQKCIAQLPEGYRTVLTLYLIEGYDHAEIGDILGISESTSKTQFLRAKNKLKQLLTQQGYEG